MPYAVCSLLLHSEFWALWMSSSVFRCLTRELFVGHSILRTVEGMLLQSHGTRSCRKGWEATKRSFLPGTGWN